jgi:hypothetical protein
MKEFKVEFKEITTYQGSIKADNIKEAEHNVLIGSIAKFEPVQGETKIQFIEELNNHE